jgi:uncharacterized protein YcbX
MAETRERMQRLRQRREARGEKAAVIWFTPAGYARLNRLRRNGENMSQVVDRGLEALDQEHAPGPYTVTTDVSIDDMNSTTHHTADMSYAQRRPALVQRIRTMTAEGLSTQIIANRLNAEGVPTLSGRGTWKKGTIGNLLAEDLGAHGT